MMKFAILLRENNAKDRKLIESYLRNLSLPVDVVDWQKRESYKGRVDIVITGISRASDDEVGKLSKEIKELREDNPKVQIILCADGNINNLDEISMQLRARTFLLKPLDMDNFTRLVEKTIRVIRKRKLRESYLKRSSKTSHIMEIIGKSNKIVSVLKLLEKVSLSRDTSVLFLGESGTGKSMLAKALHEMSNRANGPFIEINCSSIPTNLMESELFGYEPGAFTDAKNEKVGLIELADEGTLFLDEITEVDIQTQAKLLKFLDTKKIRRLGGATDIKIDTRIVAASNRDIKEEVKNRSFREDLYFRLNVIEIVIPPLRERKEDIPPIVNYYFNEYKRKFNKPDLGISEKAMEMICNYPWPGNVRELINVLERATLLARGNSIGKDDLPLPRKEGVKYISLEKSGDEIKINLPPGGVHLEELEKKVIEETLKVTRGNVVRAAKLLGLNRGALRYKILKYKIRPRLYHKAKIEPEEVMS